jgi:hypothetical protein
MMRTPGKHRAAREAKNRFEPLSLAAHCNESGEAFRANMVRMRVLFGPYFNINAENGR